jgi:membrane-associated HD superfamily phosphohydrolase
MNLSKTTHANQRRPVSSAGYIFGMLAGSLVIAFIGAVDKIDTHNIARELYALAMIALTLAPLWILLLCLPVVVGTLPFMAMRKFAPQNKMARPLFILLCFAFIWFFCILANIVLSQFMNRSPYFPSPYPPVMTQLLAFSTTQVVSLMCVVITGALVCWRIDSNEPNVAVSTNVT